VTVLTSAQTTEATGNGSKVKGLHYTDCKSGAKHTIELDCIFVQIGLLPNTNGSRVRLPCPGMAKLKSTAMARARYRPKLRRSRWRLDVADALRLKTKAGK
jgi:hypothetical protein